VVLACATLATATKATVAIRQIAIVEFFSRSSARSPQVDAQAESRALRYAAAIGRPSVDTIISDYRASRRHDSAADLREKGTRNE
jgi:hypothetical protein